MATAAATVVDLNPPAVSTNMPDAPVPVINGAALALLAADFGRLFTQYAADRLPAEQKFLRNLRQFLGIYDPEVEQALAPNRSRAYPRITRTKCISVLSRIINLMFPGNERSWEVQASPSPEMSPQDVAQAVQELITDRQSAGLEGELSDELVNAAMKRFADKCAEMISLLIDDQLKEIGGDQTLDYISLNRQVALSGIMYGLGLLEGPYVREDKKTHWGRSEGGFAPQTKTIYKPLYEFLPVWDFYPDMSSKSLPGDGYFVRKVMGRSQVRKLANRPDFFGEEVKKYLKMDTQGNYKPQSFENELKVMGTRVTVNEVASKRPDGKYEIIIWKGPVSADKLKDCGVPVPESMMADDVEAELWMLGGKIIKAAINSWRMLGCDVQTVHCFNFDANDTSPIGDGLPNIMRDDQMSICATVRMALDNASVTCGPNLEVNTRLMQAGQDITAVEGYKIWYRDDDDPSTAAFPAVREIKIDGHISELQQLTEMFMRFADITTFVGPATGGDMQQAPSEPMRTAAGQSMVKGDAALPFKDIIRNFDFFTQSVILSLVHFNRKFNPALAPAGDYDVIARGATSLIAKEVRGMQIDMLAQTLSEEDKDWVDDEKFVKQRFAVRDMESMLLPKEEAMQKRAARVESQTKQFEATMQKMAGEYRESLANAYKSVTQGQKNASTADANTANTAIDIMSAGAEDANEASGSKA